MSPPYNADFIEYLLLQILRTSPRMTPEGLSVVGKRQWRLENPARSLSPDFCLDQAWCISVPSTFRHSRMKAASAVQPLAETMVPST